MGMQTNLAPPGSVESAMSWLSSETVELSTGLETLAARLAIVTRPAPLTGEAVGRPEYNCSLAEQIAIQANAVRQMINLVRDQLDRLELP